MLNMRKYNIKFNKAVSNKSNRKMLANINYTTFTIFNWYLDKCVCECECV